MRNVDLVFESYNTLLNRGFISISYDLYLNLQYHSYLKVCDRCDVKPLTIEQWKKQDGSTK